MTLGERIKKLRKEKDLTQQEFADRLGMKRNSIAQVETGRNTSEQTIISICREFNVSEEWLRAGKGEMFQPTPETTIDKIVQEFHLDDLDRWIIMEYLQLSEEDRKIIKSYIQKIVQHISIENQSTQIKKLTLEEEADEFAELARKQFLLGKR